MEIVTGCSANGQHGYDCALGIDFIHFCGHFDTSQWRHLEMPLESFLKLTQPVTFNK